MPVAVAVSRTTFFLCDATFLFCTRRLFASYSCVSSRQTPSSLIQRPRPSRPAQLILLLLLLLLRARSITQGSLPAAR